jgi:hypothetical protein
LFAVEIGHYFSPFGTLLRRSQKGRQSGKFNGLCGRTFGCTFRGTFGRTLAGLHGGIVGNLHQGAAIVPRLGPPSQPIRAHPYGISGQAEPIPSLRPCQPLRHR